MLNEHIVFSIGSVCITNYGFFAALAVILSTVSFYVLNSLSGAKAQQYVIPSLLLPAMGTIYVTLRNLSGETIGGVELAAAQLAAVPVQIIIAAVSASLLHDCVNRVADGMAISAALGWAVFCLSNTVELATAEFVVYFLISAFLAADFYFQYARKKSGGSNVTLLSLVLLGAAGFLFGGMSDCGLWVLGSVNLVRVFWCTAAAASAAAIIIRNTRGRAVIHGAICTAMWLTAICCDLSGSIGIITGAFLLVMCADVYFCQLAGMREKPEKAKSRKKTEAGRNSAKRHQKAAHIEDDDYKELMSVYSGQKNSSGVKKQDYSDKINR